MGKKINVEEWRASEEGGSVEDRSCYSIHWND